MASTTQFGGARARQLWQEVRDATGLGMLHEDVQDQLEAGGLVDVSIMAPPPVALGQPMTLPRGRAPETAMERYFAAAGKAMLTASPENSIQSLDVLHELLLDANVLGWFSCTLWAVILAEFSQSRPHADINPDYVGALFLNMSFFFTSTLRQHPILQQGTSMALVDIAVGVSGAVVHLLRTMVPASQQPLAMVSAAFAPNVTRNVLRWTIGIDGMEKVTGASSNMVHEANRGPSPEEVPAAPTAATLSNTISLRQQRLKRFEETLLAIEEHARQANGAAVRNDATPALGAHGSHLLHTQHASVDRRAPLLSRSVALKRVGSGNDDGAAHGNGPRATFTEIHQRCQLTRDARRLVLERDKDAKAAATRRQEAVDAVAAAYALGHMITKETWTDPQRYYVRSFSLDAVSPMVQLFLVATSQTSADILGQSNVGISAYQRVHRTPIARVQLHQPRASSAFRLPRCPRCGNEVTRAPMPKVPSSPSVGPTTSSPTCGQCHRAVTASVHRHAYLVCTACDAGSLCRTCVVTGPNSKVPRPVSASSAQRPADDGKGNADLVALFGTAATMQWCCYIDDDHQGTAVLHQKSTRTCGGGNGIAPRNPTAARWSQLLHELMGAHQRSMTPEEAKFHWYVRSANVGIASDLHREVDDAFEAAVDAMEGAAVALDAAAMSDVAKDGAAPYSTGGGVRPAARPTVQGAKRPPSAPTHRVVGIQEPHGAAPPPANSSGTPTFLTGIPVSHTPKDSVLGDALLNRPMTPLRRPSSAMSRCSSVGSGAGHRPAAVRRPLSALSRASTSHSVVTSLSVGQRPTSASIPWTTVQPNECAALSRFRTETRDTVEACLVRINTINAQGRANDEAHLAAGKAYKANISRYAVEYLQEVKRTSDSLRQNERDEVRRAMSITTAAIEAAAGTFHHPLKAIDAVKDALYAIDQEFEHLPESFRAFALRYTAGHGALLASKIRDYKMMNRDQSQWPASLDDLRCSRSREAEKYGAGAVYQSPVRRGRHWRPLKAHSRATDLDGEDHLSDGGGGDNRLPSPRSSFGADSAPHPSGDSSGSWDRTVQSTEQHNEVGPVVPEATVAETIETLYASLQSSKREDSVAMQTPLMSRKFDALPSEPSRRNVSMAPPSCMPAVPIGGSSTLVSRAGVMVWDDTQSVVGRQASDARARYAERQGSEDDPFRLVIKLAL